MKRVLIIVDSLNTGGAETFLMKLYRAMDLTNYQMDFVVSDKGYYDSEVISKGGRIFCVPFRTRRPISVYRQIRQIVKDNGYTSVLKLGTTPIAVLDVLAAKDGGAKTLAVRSCNSYSNDSLLYKIANKLLRPCFDKTVNVKIAPSDLAAIFTFGNDAYNNGEVTILHNSIDLDYFSYDSQKRDRVRQELGISDRKVYGHVGRFSKQKNHVFLIDVFSEIHRMDTNSVLVLVGSGEQEKNIKEYVSGLGLQNSVLFLGIRDDMPSVFSAMDVFVFPSLFEGMPNTVIEAQAVGIPCVVSDTITRTVDITGLVSFLPINQGTSVWVKTCMSKSTKGIEDTKQSFIDNKYDINSSLEKFISLLY